MKYLFMPNVESGIESRIRQIFPSLPLFHLFSVLSAPFSILIQKGYVIFLFSSEDGGGQEAGGREREGERVESIFLSLFSARPVLEWRSRFFPARVCVRSVSDFHSSMIPVWPPTRLCGWRELFLSNSSLIWLFFLRIYDDYESPRSGLSVLFSGTWLKRGLSWLAPPMMDDDDGMERRERVGESDEMSKN
jgi:hypothetical protein